MQISDLMTRDVTTLYHDDAIKDHLDTFKSHKLHHLPVVTAEKKVVGMLSNKDVENYINITRIMNQGKPMLVRDLMTTPIFSYYEDVKVQDAAQAMLDNNINAIVVMDKADNLAGILTSTDLIRYVAQNRLPV